MNTETLAAAGAKETDELENLGLPVVDGPDEEEEVEEEEDDDDDNEIED